MRIISFSLLFIAFYTQAEGIDTLRLSEVSSSLSLKNRAYYLTSTSDADIQSVLLKVQKKEDLFPLVKTNFGYNNDIYWLIIPVQVDINPTEKILLELQNPHYDRLQAWCLTKDGLSKLGDETGDDLPFNSRSIIHRNFIWDIQQCEADQFSIIIRIEKRTSAFRLPVYVWTGNEHNYFYGKEDIILGISYGMMILVGIYSLIAGFFLRRKIYFTYTAFIITAILLLTTHKGLSFQFLYPNWGGFNSIFNVAITRLATFALIIFSQQFLRTKTYTPIVHRLLNYVLLVYLITIIGSPFLLDFYIRQSMVMLPLMLVVNFAGNILCLLAAIFSFKNQKSIASFYIVAYLAAHFSGMLTIIQEFGWIEEITFDALLISAVIEVLVFSFGLTFLIKKIYDERNELSIKIVKQQKESLNTYLQGVEKERERIAGELHDDIGSRLGNLNRIISSKQHNDPAYIEKQIENLSHDVRNLSHQLMPPASLAKGLAQAVSNLVADFKSSTGIKINLQLFDVPADLNLEISKQCYRIIQEAINNIVKHAKATEVDVQIFGHEKELVLTIEDNGAGFNTNNINDGIGINQMKTRARLMNATLDIHSIPGKGSQILLTIPL